MTSVRLNFFSKIRGNPMKYDGAEGDGVARTRAFPDGVWERGVVVALPSRPAEQGYIELPELPKYLEWRKRRTK